MEVQIQYRFTIIDEDTGSSFSDALYFPLSEWPVSEATLKNMEQERFDNWKQAITTSADPPPVEEQVAAIDDQIESLQQQKESLLAQLEVS
jgi:hypothetical protein